MKIGSVFKKTLEGLKIAYKCMLMHKMLGYNWQFFWKFSNNALIKAVKYLLKPI